MEERGKVTGVGHVLNIGVNYKSLEEGYKEISRQTKVLKQEISQIADFVNKTGDFSVLNKSLVDSRRQLDSFAQELAKLKGTLKSTDVKSLEGGISGALKSLESAIGVAKNLDNAVSNIGASSDLSKGIDGAKKSMEGLSKEQREYVDSLKAAIEQMEKQVKAQQEINNAQKSEKKSTWGSKLVSDDYDDYGGGGSGKKAKLSPAKEAYIYSKELRIQDTYAPGVEKLSKDIRAGLSRLTAEQVKDFTEEFNNLLDFYGQMSEEHGIRDWERMLGTFRTLDQTIKAKIRETEPDSVRVASTEGPSSSLLERVRVVTQLTDKLKSNRADIEALGDVIKDKIYDPLGSMSVEDIAGTFMKEAPTNQLKEYLMLQKDIAAHIKHINDIRGTEEKQAKQAIKDAQDRAHLEAKIAQQVQALNAELEKTNKINKTLKRPEITAQDLGLPTTDITEIQKLLSGRNVGDYKTFLNAVNTGLTRTKTEFREISKEVPKLTSLMQELGGNTLKVAKWMLSVRAVMLLGRAMSSAVRTMTEFEKTLIGVRMVMPMLEKDAKKVTDEIFRMSGAFARSATEAGKVVEELARQGKSYSDIRALMGPILAAANIADLPATDSVKFLTSELLQFNMQARDGIQLLDSWAQVGDKTAVSARDLADAASKSAKAAQLAGIDYHWLHGIIATLGEVAGKTGSEVGTSLRRIFTKFPYQSTISAIGSAAGIDVLDDEKNMRNYIDVLTELADKWEHLSFVQKTQITSTFGSIRASDFINIIENWDKVIRNTEISLTSAGAAYRKNEMYMSSLSAQIQKLKAAAERLAISFGESGVLGALKVLTIGTSKFLDILNKAPGSVLTFAATVGVLALALNKLGMAAKAIEYLGTTQSILGIIPLAGAGMGKYILALGAVAVAITGLLSYLGAFEDTTVSTTTKLYNQVDAIEANIKKLQELSDAYKDSINVSSWIDKTASAFESMSDGLRGKLISAVESELRATQEKIKFYQDLMEFTFSVNLEDYGLNKKDVPQSIFERVSRWFQVESGVPILRYDFAKDYGYAFKDDASFKFKDSRLNKWFDEFKKFADEDFMVALENFNEMLLSAENLEKELQTLQGTLKTTLQIAKEQETDPDKLFLDWLENESEIIKDNNELYQERKRLLTDVFKTGKLSIQSYIIELDKLEQFNPFVKLLETLNEVNETLETGTKSAVESAFGALFDGEDFGEAMKKAMQKLNRDIAVKMATSWVMDSDYMRDRLALTKIGMGAFLGAPTKGIYEEAQTIADINLTRQKEQSKEQEEQKHAQPVIALAGSAEDAIAVKTREEVSDATEAIQQATDAIKVQTGATDDLSHTLDEASRVAILRASLTDAQESVRKQIIDTAIDKRGTIDPNMLTLLALLESSFGEYQYSGGPFRLTPIAYKDLPENKREGLSLQTIGDKQYVVGESVDALIAGGVEFAEVLAERLRDPQYSEKFKKKMQELGKLGINQAEAFSIVWFTGIEGFLNATLDTKPTEDAISVGTRLERTRRDAKALGIDLDKLNLYLGYSNGGFTGFGHKLQPAGVVHANEWVMPKWMTEKYPELVKMLEGMRLKGYASGGLVGGSGGLANILPKELVNAYASFKKVLPIVGIGLGILMALKETNKKVSAVEKDISPEVEAIHGVLTDSNELIEKGIDVSERTFKLNQSLTTIPDRVNKVPQEILRGLTGLPSINFDASKSKDVPGDMLNVAKNVATSKAIAEATKPQDDPDDELVAAMIEFFINNQPAEKKKKSLFSRLAKPVTILGLLATFFDALPGFASGGYTGRGLPNRVAGLVHEDEYVINERMVKANPGLVSLLEDARRTGRDKVFGYQSGGLAGYAPSLGDLYKGLGIKMWEMPQLNFSESLKSVSEPVSNLHKLVAENLPKFFPEEIIASSDQQELVKLAIKFFRRLDFVSGGSASAVYDLFTSPDNIAEVYSFVKGELEEIAKSAPEIAEYWFDVLLEQISKATGVRKEWLQYTQDVMTPEERDRLARLQTVTDVMKDKDAIQNAVSAVMMQMGVSDSPWAMGIAALGGLAKGTKYEEVLGAFAVDKLGFREDIMGSDAMRIIASVVGAAGNKQQGQPYMSLLLGGLSDAILGVPMLGQFIGSFFDRAKKDLAKEAEELRWTKAVVTPDFFSLDERYYMSGRYAMGYANQIGAGQQVNNIAAGAIVVYGADDPVAVADEIERRFGQQTRAGVFGTY